MTGGGTNKNSFLFGTKRCIQVALAVLLIMVCAGSHGAAEEETKASIELPYDTNKRSHGEGMIEYLLRTEQLNVDSGYLSVAYTLTRTNLQDSKNQPGDILLHYDIEDKIVYYDKITGLTVELAPEEYDPRRYTAVTLKDIQPVYYQFDLSGDIWSYEGGTEVQATFTPQYGKYSPRYPLAGKTFTYTYNKADSYDHDDENSYITISGSAISGKDRDISSFYDSSTKTITITGVIANKEHISKNTEDYSCSALHISRTKGVYDKILIEADFINNKTDHKGGAIIIEGNNSSPGVDIDLIRGNFFNNASVAEGGAIWIYATTQSPCRVGLIEGDFVGNHVSSIGRKSNKGGAIMVGGSGASIDTIIGDFIGNWAEGSTEFSEENGVIGGTISNSGGSTIGSIYGNFIGNYILRTNGTVQSAEGHGAGIYNRNNSKIGTIVGDFIGNYVGGEQQSGKAWGAAITNQQNADIEHIVGDFVQNTIYANDSVGGGAIYNNRGANIITIQGNFIQNGSISNWDGHYIPNYDQHGPQEAGGGAIYNSYVDKSSTSIQYIEGSFYENYALATDQSFAYGGAIACTNNSIEEKDKNYYAYIGTIKGDFIGNYAKAEGKLKEDNTYKGDTLYARGGAIYADGRSKIEKIYGNFYYNYAYSGYDRAYGGAICNASSIEQIINALFIGNYAQSAHGKKENDPMSGAHGGAIFNQSELGFTADDYKSIFQGNYILNGTNEDDKYYEAIYATKDSKITFNAVHDGHIIFEDIITGDEGHKLILTGDTTSFITFNNHVINAEVTCENLVLNLGVASAPILGHENEPQSYLDPIISRVASSNVFRKSSLEMNSGIVSLMDGNFAEYIFEKPITIYGLDKVEDGVGTQWYTNNTVEIQPGGNRAAYASFSFDVNLDDTYDEQVVPDDKTGFKEVVRAKGDVITVFGTWDDEKKEWSNRSKGRITLSSLTLYAIDSATKYGPTNTIEVIVQLINFVALDKNGNEIKEATGMEWFEEKIDDDFLRVTDHFNHYTDPTALMLSNAILASDIIIETTKTKDDSIRIVSWRDNLAEWAEHEKTADPNDKFAEVAGEKSGRKVFTLVADDAHHYLTRDINLEEGKTKSDNAIMWGDDLTIEGECNELILDLQHKNLLSQIGDRGENKDQKVRLQNFTLKDVGTAGGGENQIYNYTSLTLDTLKMNEEEATVHNEGQEVRVTGRTMLNYTITTDDPATYGNMYIENSSRVVDRSITYITGAIERQNITHSGESLEDVDPQELVALQARDASPLLTDDLLADENYTTVTHLITTTDGKATEAFKRFQQNSLSMEGGKFNLYDMHHEVLQLRDLEMKGGLIHVSSSTVDLAGEKMGGIFATESADYSGGIIWLDKIAITSDGKGLVTHVRFVNPEVGDAVQDNKIRDTYVWGPKYKYLVTYNDDTRENDRGEVGQNGYYTFSRTAETNPTVQAPSVAEVTGGFTQMMQIYEYSFEHADLFSATMENTLGARNSGVVVTPVKGYKEVAPAAATCPTQEAGLHSSMWVRPYAGAEKMNLHNGPTVNSSIYGALVGADARLREHRSGWASVFSAYGAYMGATQKFAGNTTHQNGGAVGLSETFYKGKFYTAVTATAGISDVRTNTAYGPESYDMLIAGVASRTGYSMNLGTCRYVLQPTLLMSYTLVNASDYTSASGMSMETDPLQVFQIHPYVKAIMHTMSGWNPYVTLGYVHNFMGKTNSYADGDKLPEMSIDPYVEYSIGVQKTWRSKYTLYGSATGRHGGRNGAEVSAGLRRAW